MVYFGSVAQILALASSSLSIFLSIAAYRKKDAQMLFLAKRMVQLHFSLLLICVVCLLGLLSEANFSVLYVAEHVNVQLPFFYRLTSIWAGQAGSMLWWNFLMVLFSMIAIHDIEKKEPRLLPHVIAILMSCSLFFLALSNFSQDSDPFQLITVGGAPFFQENGKGLNPLLQHWAMIIHPPLLYLGYVSFVVPFAIAFSALIQKRINLNWSALVRKWSIFSWFFLGVGMLLGGKWAYEELGWGGYWAWDPVENAALMPWITGTAFLHSILVQEKRGMLKVWNMTLVALSFVMCIFGTFLTRSGIVSSVHAFASSELGPFFVMFMVGIIIFSTYFIVTRLSILKSDKSFNSFLSREAGFLYNNVILLISLFVVIWGTMYPTISEALFSERISVTQVWFDKWMAPLGIIILFLTGSGPLLAWRKTNKETLIKNFKLPSIVFITVIIAYITFIYFNLDNPHSFANRVFTNGKLILKNSNIKAGLIFAVAAFLVTGVLEEIFKVVRNRIAYTKEPLLVGAMLAILQNKKRYVGYLIHISIALLFVGFAGKAFTKETRLLLREGEAQEFYGFLFHVTKFETLEYRKSKKMPPLYTTKKVMIQVFKDNHFLGENSTEIRTYPMYSLQNRRYDDQQTTSEPAIIPYLLDDFYVQFAGVDETSHRLIFQVWINSLVRVVWIGFGCFIFAGLLLLMPIGEGKTIRIGKKKYRLQAQAMDTS